MDLHFHQATSELVRAAGYNDPISSLTFKRGDAVTLRLGIYDSTGSLVELAGGSSIVFALKEDYDGEPLAIADIWTEADGIYSAPFDTNTAEVLAALGEDASTTVLGELTYSENGTDWTSSQTLQVTIEKDVITDGEVDPTVLASRGYMIVGSNTMTEDRSLDEDDLGKSIYAPTPFTLTLPYPIDSEWEGKRFRISEEVTLAGYALKDNLGTSVSGFSPTSGYAIIEIIGGEYRLDSQDPALCRRSKVSTASLSEISGSMFGGLYLIVADCVPADGYTGCAAGWNIDVINNSGSAKTISLAAKATGYVLATSQVADGNSVTIGAVTYTWRAAPSGPGEILIGADLEESMGYLWEEIIGDGSLAAHADVTAFEPEVAGGGWMVRLEAKVAGAAANSITVNGSGLEDEDGMSGGVDATVNGVSQGVVTVADGERVGIVLLDAGPHTFSAHKLASAAVA